MKQIAFYPIVKAVFGIDMISVIYEPFCCFNEDLQIFVKNGVQEVDCIRVFNFFSFRLENHKFNQRIFRFYKILHIG